MTTTDNTTQPEPEMKQKTEQYQGEDIFCKDECNMVTQFTGISGCYVTEYKKDLFNNVWVMQWIIKQPKHDMIRR